MPVQPIAPSARLCRVPANPGGGARLDLSRMGFAGTTLSFVNFTAELPYFCETVLPILQAADLRT